LSIVKSGIDLELRHPARIPLTVFIVAVLAYTAIAPNFDQPFVCYAFAGAVIFLALARIGTRNWVVAVVAAIGFGLLHISIPRSEGAATSSLSLYSSMLGRGCLAVLGGAAIWADPETRRRLYRMWILPVAIILFDLASLLALNLTLWAKLPVLDYYLYIFDGSLGVQPSFLLGRIFSNYKLVDELAREIYRALPLAIAAVCAGYLNRKPFWKPLLILATAGVLGYALYFVFPAAGPLYVAGPNFPWSPHPFAALRQMHPHLIALPTRAPRNAMPSLHMAWALLLWFNSRPFSRVARALAVGFVVVTMAATLGTGEHYLIDLVVALPFSVAVQAVWAFVSARKRYAVLAGAGAMTLAWLVTLRYCTSFFLVSPAIPWSFIAASSIVSLRLEQILHTLSPEVATPRG
jgi:hypothetical protein